MPSGTPAAEPRLWSYPEREDRRDGWQARLEALCATAPAALGHRSFRLRARGFLRRVNAAEPAMRQCDERELAAVVTEVRSRLRRDGLDPVAVCRAFALVRELSRRSLGLRHHDVQLLGGLAILRGHIAEMDTGEGKTVTAALAAATAAMSGEAVQVVTVNDYLAERDATGLAPLYAQLGLQVAVIKAGMSPDERRRAYQANIVYGSNKEIAFDYLRDRLALEGRPQELRRRVHQLSGGACPESRLVMRGLHFAIVDEADSVLVDESRTPLIISRKSDVEDEKRWAETAIELAQALRPGEHFNRKATARRIELTSAGRAFVENLAQGYGGIWDSRIRRDESVRQALSALHLFRRGDQYLVQDGKVQIVDEYTGRIQADRSWSEGLHQLVEVKEGVEVTARNLPVARMTYQRFFRRYMRLAGMTGTASEVRTELWRVYGLGVVRVPPHRPSRRKRYPVTVARTLDDKWDRVVARAQRERECGRPVLIGTRSVLASEIVSERLGALGLEHEVLNAQNDAEEARIIAQAGQTGRITVATNMAGRGVDIALDEAVVASGGLHVILTEWHDARRIDRQLEGRAARRGQPGSAEAILSLQDPLLDLLHAKISRLLVGFPLAGRTGLLLMRLSQRRVERRHALARRDLLRQDQRLVRLLAFAGGVE
ncbi:hypothetical protein GCM10011348_43740 [Marinobacterium nitratireducens]|uniref:Protein translocase subunit SecA n=1 Tax=Marinobacterium nitratireducens TaxID=518897 RepID=A0A918DYM5_9GAMM|nr:hypothetical protein [Marinobacterium nitratireducens]GGO88390.1 hypothetical protein GCM10011348_43740 [Marinobacterium nitratireducens]